MPSQTFSASAPASSPPPEIWAKLDLPEVWQGITGVDEVFDEILGLDGHLEGFKFYTALGGRRYVGTATPGGRDEGRSLTWNISTPEIKGQIAVSLALSPGGAIVEVTMQVESVSMMASMAFPFIAAAIGKGFQATVDDFVNGFQSA